jgi:hypothetical protein
VRRAIRVIAAVVAAALGTATFSASPLGLQGARVAAAATPPLVGFSFSPKTAVWLGEDPDAALEQLVEDLSPDLVRLPVYWDAVESDPGLFDFSEVDQMLTIVRDYNRAHPSRPARVILEVGMRNMGYPELYLPSWLSAAERASTAAMSADVQYANYLSASISRYRGDPLLSSWQLENEPLDNVPTTAAPQVDIPGDVLQDEVETLQRTDPAHPVVITTFDSSTLSLDLKALSPASSQNASRSGPQPAGHPLQALQLGDALGMDAYVVTGDTSLTDASAHKRTDWKRDALKYWSAQARTLNKPLWITEMQGSPWPGQTDFTPADLLYSAQLYRSTGASVVLLWGVESWLGSPQWMSAGHEARQLIAR